MQVNYCDLCNQPLKENDYYVLFVSTPKIYLSGKDYFDYMEKVRKETKEICPTCKLVFDEIFKLRLQNLSQLAINLLGIYELSSDSIKKIKDYKKSVKPKKKKNPKRKK